MEFQINCTVLYRARLRDLTQTFIKTFAESPQKLFGFVDDRPGRHWIELFLKLNAQLTLKTRMNLEQERADAMNP